jgi:cytochrome c553
MRFIAIVFLLFTSCSPGGPHKEGGGIEGLNSPNGASVGYDSVKPIFAKYCSACHPSRSGPDWLDYSSAAKEAKSGILYFKILTERSMPPPTSPQGAQISEAERLAIGSWARAGGPQKPAQAVPSPQPTEAPPKETTPKYVRACMHCHGASGPEGLAEPRIPVLVGQNEAYLERELMRFKSGKRIDPSNAGNSCDIMSLKVGCSMNEVAIQLTTDQIHVAADYYASRPYGTKAKFPKFSADEEALFTRGSTLAHRDCVSCHYNADYGERPTDALVPALAGQSKVYLTNQLLYFRGDELSNPLMHQLALRLGNADIVALSFYFANLH